MVLQFFKFLFASAIFSFVSVIDSMMNWLWGEKQHAEGSDEIFSKKKTKKFRRCLAENWIFE